VYIVVIEFLLNYFCFFFGLPWLRHRGAAVVPPWCRCFVTVVLLFRRRGAASPPTGSRLAVAAS